VENVKACRARSVNAKPATTRGEKGVNRELHAFAACNSPGAAHDTG